MKPTKKWSVKRRNSPICQSAKKSREKKGFEEWTTRVIVQHWKFDARRVSDSEHTLSLLQDFHFPSSLPLLVSLPVSPFLLSFLFCFFFPKENAEKERPSLGRCPLSPFSSYLPFFLLFPRCLSCFGHIPPFLFFLPLFLALISDCSSWAATTTIILSTFLRILLSCIISFFFSTSLSHSSCWISISMVRLCDSCRDWWSIIFLFRC